MTIERLNHLADMCEAGPTLPPATHAWLRDCLRRWQAGDELQAAFGLTVVNALAERNQIIRDHAVELPGPPWAKCRAIAAEARRIHRGRRSALPWIAKADRLRPLPETPRQIYNLLK